LAEKTAKKLGGYFLAAPCIELIVIAGSTRTLRTTPMTTGLRPKKPVASGGGLQTPSAKTSRLRQGEPAAEYRPAWRQETRCTHTIGLVAVVVATVRSVTFVSWARQV